MATKKQPEPEKPASVTLTSNQLMFAAGVGAFFVLPGLLCLTFLQGRLVQAVVLFMGGGERGAEFIGIMAGVVFFIAAGIAASVFIQTWLEEHL